MNASKYKWILYTIVAVIITTIGIQVYWNYKNYQTNKQQLIRDVQTSLDKAVDDYYADLAERSTFGVILKGDEQKNAFEEGGNLERFLKGIDINDKGFKYLDSINPSNVEGLTVFKGYKADSISAAYNKKNKTISLDSFKQQVKELKGVKDELGLSNIEMLTSKVMISIKNDTLDVREINKLLNKDLKQKKLGLDHMLSYNHSAPDENSKLYKMMNTPKFKGVLKRKDYKIYVESKSKFLPEGSILKLGFENETRNILKRSLVGILISTLLVLAVISCLFYLLKIIKHQKQLAEVKNDLISNITHEFKTPIATISVALESIRNFNVLDDIEKTKKYLNMSSEQLGKLNIMVEKLLETATLDSDNLELKKEPIDIIEVLDAITNRYKIQFPEKEFNTSFKIESLICNADVFHIENAINNILDNAVKYGGHIISIDLIPKDKNFDILISDNGNTLTKTNKDRIFEKFYRVPKGNTHDVKGFGIGLYYTKTIIEKHKGSVNLELSKNLTTFKISLPNG
jgi:signal transduction histidine kinase